MLDGYERAAKERELTELVASFQADRDRTIKKMVEEFDMTIELRPDGSYETTVTLPDHAPVREVGRWTVERGSVRLGRDGAEIDELLPVRRGRMEVPPTGIMPVWLLLRRE
jgi:hypothetical protein